MTLQALDGPILYLLIAVGLIFALSGLYFILKRKDDENAARIELFGLKFQSSSVGTLVFLIGAAFLLIPLFAPKSPDVRTVEPGQPDAATLQETEFPATTNGSATGQRAVLLPASADTAESEPNDQLVQSNQIGLGFGVKGTLDRARDDYDDWYVVDVSESGNVDFTIQIRTLSGRCNVRAYDQNEEQLAWVTCSNSGSVNFDIFSQDNDVLFFKVAVSGSPPASYELFVRKK